MYADYVDHWDALPADLQAALTPICDRFDEAADLLFDRRLNLSFEAAVKDLSLPGVIALTEALRHLSSLLLGHVTVADPDAGILRYDGGPPLTAYDLPLYTPCLYLSQLAQSLDERHVRVWKAETACEIGAILGIMTRFVRPGIEIERVLLAAWIDLARLHPESTAEVARSAASEMPNERRIAAMALSFLRRGQEAPASPPPSL